MGQGMKRGGPGSYIMSRGDTRGVSGATNNRKTIARVRVPPATSPQAAMDAVFPDRLSNTRRGILMPRTR